MVRYQALCLINSAQFR